MINSVSSNSASAIQSPAASSAEARHKAIFDKLDTNGDGKIDSLELSAAASQKGKGADAAALMKKIDTNGDGTISESESDAFLTAKENAKKTNVQNAPDGPRPHGHHHGGGAAGAASAAGTSTRKYSTNSIRTTTAKFRSKN
jgi:hypothetical protein